MWDVADGAGQVDDVLDDHLASMTIVITLAKVVGPAAEDFSVASEFRDGIFPAVVVDQCLACGSGGNQRRTSRWAQSSTSSTPYRSVESGSVFRI
jgi:hypothetical protein